MARLRHWSAKLLNFPFFRGSAYLRKVGKENEPVFEFIYLRVESTIERRLTDEMLSVFTWLHE